MHIKNNTNMKHKFSKKEVLDFIRTQIADCIPVKIFAGGHLTEADEFTSEIYLTYLESDVAPKYKGLSKEIAPEFGELEEGEYVVEFESVGATTREVEQILIYSIM